MKRLRLTLLAAGLLTLVTACGDGGPSGVAVTGVDVTPTSPWIGVGETVQLTAAVRGGGRVTLVDLATGELRPVPIVTAPATIPALPLPSCAMPSSASEEPQGQLHSSGRFWKVHWTSTPRFLSSVTTWLASEPGVLSRQL